MHPASKHGCLEAAQLPPSLPPSLLPSFLRTVRVAPKCSFKVCVSSIKASHSFWKRARRPGTEVAVTGRGRTTRNSGGGEGVKN